MWAEENEVSIKSVGGTEITKRSLDKYIDQDLAKEFQIIPSRIGELAEDKIRVLWLHDTAQDPMYSFMRDPVEREKIHHFVFSSHWQMEKFVMEFGIPMSQNMSVIETPIEPFDQAELVKPTDKVNLIYFSTPQRGLELLVPVFEELVKHHPEIHLDVFSSFKIYGWEDADKQFEPIYERLRNIEQATYHGFAEQAVVREVLKKAHILAYPCIWAETSCRVLIESMSAGLLCVHPNYAVLPETSGGLTLMYQMSQALNEHANIFYLALQKAIEDVRSERVQTYLRLPKVYADARFNIAGAATKWNLLMEDLIRKYPTVESRKFQEDFIEIPGI